MNADEVGKKKVRVKIRILPVFIRANLSKEIQGKKIRTTFIDGGGGVRKQ